MRLVELSAPQKNSLVGGPFGSKLGSRDYISDGVPVIRGGNLPDHSMFQFKDFVFISEEKADQLISNNAHPGDLVFTQRGTLGQVGLIPQKSPYKRFVISQSQMKLTVDETKADAYFLYSYFCQPSTIEEIKKLAMSSGIPHINLDILRKFEVPVPPLKIQKKIAAILSAYDDLIENNNHRIAILEKMAEEIYRQWFVRMRFPEHEKVKFKKGVPEGWEIVKFGNLINLTMGQSPKSQFYNTIGAGLPFNQGVGTYGDRFPKKEIYCSVRGRIALKGDILFSVRAPVGRLNIADCKMTIGRGLAAISHKKGYNSYLFYMLKNNFSDEDILGNGAIFNSVGKDELNKFPIINPKEDLIKKYNKIASKLDLEIENLHNAQKILTQSRELMLSRLISGKLSVEDLDIRFPKSMEDNGA